MSDTGQNRSQLLAEIEGLKARIRALEEDRARSSMISVYLSALTETARTLLSRRDVREILSAVVTHACHQLNAQHGFCVTVGRTGAIRFEAAIGFAESMVGREMDPEGLTGLVIESHGAQLINDYSNWPGRSPNVEPENLSATMAVPLMSGPHLEGVMTLCRATPAPDFTDEELQIAGTFAELASIALDNARLFLTLQSELARKDEAERALRDSEHRIRQLLEFSPDATLAIDRRGRVITWNRAMEELTGVPASAMLGKGDHAHSIPFYGIRRPILVDLVLKEDRDADSYYPNIVRDGDTITTEVYLPNLRPGGTHLWGKARATYDENGRVNGAIESLRDITERKRYEEAIDDSRRRLQSYHGVLLELAKDSAGEAEDAGARLHRIVEATARTLEVRRAGIRILDPDRGALTCRACHEIGSNCPAPVCEVHRSTHPRYFEHLMADNGITVHDVTEDPRTREFTADPRATNAGAMMDAPVRSGRSVQGVVFVEHVGGPRRWTVEEEGFLRSVADIVALALESDRRRAAEIDLRRRLRFEDIITRAATTFLSAMHDDLDETIKDVLAEIGTFADVDRSYLFELFDRGHRMRNTHEWCAPSVTAHIHELQDLSTDEYAYIMSFMRRRSVFYASPVSDLPPEAAVERGEFEREHIQSIICVPIHVHGELLGFMGFDAVRSVKTWSDDDIRLLHIMGELIAHALEHKRHGA